MLARVGLGCLAPLNMSENVGRGTKDGLRGAEDSDLAAKRARATHRSMVWCLTSSSNPGRASGIRPAGIAHTFAVCGLELAEMARGKDKVSGNGVSTTLPRFVDVPLGADDKRAFLAWVPEADDIVLMLSRLCDSGYRVGCSWSGEHQTYTVSLTCRNPDDVNNGLCMTSFAKTLDKALALALYKHTELTKGNWSGDGKPGSEDFG